MSWGDSWLTKRRRGVFLFPAAAASSYLLHRGSALTYSASYLADFPGAADLDPVSNEIANTTPNIVLSSSPGELNDRATFLTTATTEPNGSIGGATVAMWEAVAGGACEAYGVLGGIGGVDWNDFLGGHGGACSYYMPDGSIYGSGAGLVGVFAPIVDGDVVGVVLDVPGTQAGFYLNGVLQVIVAHPFDPGFTFPIYSRQTP